jgi:hypothetical protein
MTGTIKIIEDNTNDDLSKLLSDFNLLTHWNLQKQNFLKELISHLESSNYKLLILKEHRYKVGKVGNSFIYEISDKRRGLFAPFRGKSVRVICVASGRFDRTVMVKPI